MSTTTLITPTRDFPLVLSMTQFQHFKRCRKLFEFDAIRDLTPRRDSESASDGRAFHAFLAHAADNKGALPEGSEEHRDMLDVAREYLRYKPLPANIISAERGYFAQVAPDVYIRASFDLVYLDDGQLVIRDYKTVAKAPSMDVDMDFQSQAYLFVAEQAIGAKQARFEWEYVRRELGRFLSGGKGKDAVWTPWEDHERYYHQDLEMSELERETTRRELYNCALDIREAIERERYYRTVLRSGPHSCDTCFYRDICKADWQQGTLDEQTLALLTSSTDQAARVLPETMADDPRVAWYVNEAEKPLAEAIGAVYGRAGRAKYELFTAEKAA